MSATFSGKNPIANIKAAQLRGAELAAEYLLGEGNKIAPIEEGTLIRSGAASTEQSGSETTLAVSHDTPYSVVQHESLHFQHDSGRQAKWLETTFNSQGDTALEVIARAVRGEF